MPHRKPLSITSPTHGMALAGYFFLGFLGVFAILTFHTTDNAIVKLMGNPMVDVWSVTLTISAFGCLISAVAAAKARRPENNLRLEAIFAFGLFLNLTYLCVMISSYGPRAILSIAAFGAFAVGALFRAIQILVERGKVKKARMNPSISDPVLADPREEDGSN